MRSSWSGGVTELDIQLLADAQTSGVSWRRFQRRTPMESSSSCSRQAHSVQQAIGRLQKDPCPSLLGLIAPSWDKGRGDDSAETRSKKHDQLHLAHARAALSEQVSEDLELIHQSGSADLACGRPRGFPSSE